MVVVVVWIFVVVSCAMMMDGCCAGTRETRKLLRYSYSSSPSSCPDGMAAAKLRLVTNLVKVKVKAEQLSLACFVGASQT